MGQSQNVAKIPQMSIYRQVRYMGKISLFLKKNNLFDHVLIGISTKRSSEAAVQSIFGVSRDHSYVQGSSLA